MEDHSFSNTKHASSKNNKKTVAKQVSLLTFMHTWVGLWEYFSQGGTKDLKGTRGLNIVASKETMTTLIELTR